MTNLNDRFGRLHYDNSVSQRILTVTGQSRGSRLTVFAYDGGIWRWTRLPFGLSYRWQFICSLCSNYIEPPLESSFSFVDDWSICSDNWTQNMSHLRTFLTEIRKSGSILNVKKFYFAKHEVSFIGHVIGSGWHRPDKQTLATITDISRPITKRDVRRVFGFFL